MCPGKCHIKIRYLLKDVLELTPMWVPHEPRRGCNGHCGVTEPPPNADSLQSGVSPAGEVYSTDQSKEFCSVYTRHSVSVWACAGVSISQSGFDWADQRPGEQRCVCLPAMPLPGFPALPWHRPQLGCPQLCDSKAVFTVIGTSGCHANSWHAPTFPGHPSIWKPW